MSKENDSFRKETISRLDSLWQNVITYRQSEIYMKILEACARFRHLAPYNAMLVEVQKPGAKYVLSAKDWRIYYDRGIKPNARPLIILVPFGPVDYVFEIGDTYPLRSGLFYMSDEEILEKIAAPYRTKKEASNDLLQKVEQRLKYHGIAIDKQFVAGVDYAAQIELLRFPSHFIEFNFPKLKWDAYYLLSVNANAGKGEQFASICHELGHLFCQHLTSPRNWTSWQLRSLPHETEEFEAESIAWLVCERFGLGNPSERYLQSYTQKNSIIPKEVSIERILSATKEILSLCEAPSFSFKNGLLYKYCESFKKRIKG